MARQAKKVRELHPELILRAAILHRALSDYLYLPKDQRHTSYVHKWFCSGCPISIDGKSISLLLDVDIDGEDLIALADTTQRIPSQLLIVIGEV